MKKIISLALAACMLLSIVPMASATRDYTQGTQVIYTSSGTESYTITVPALLAPGGDGTVTLSGTWADNRIITVTAEPTVTLTNSIKADDQKVLDVHFDGISEKGSNTGSQKFTEAVSVAAIENALFGTWSGTFYYNVDIVNEAVATLGCDTLYWDGNTEGKLIVEDIFVKVSDSIILMDDLKNGFSIHLDKNGEETGATCPADSVTDWVGEFDDIVIFVDLAICIASDNLTVDAGVALHDKEVVFPEKGVYLPIKLFWAGEEVPGEGTFRLTIPGYTGFQHSEHCGH